MIPFRYARAADRTAAIRAYMDSEDARYLGGGTNLVDLMRENIERPATIIDISGLDGEIRDLPDGGLLIGAEARNTAVAAHLGVRQRYPLLARALLAGASGQIRNMATVGGNILQRTRCAYFYDTAARCNKRVHGAGCDAIEGFNRMHAILGASPACVATHPSDMCVALAALDAVIHLEGPAGVRSLSSVDFHRLAAGTPEIETELMPGELITAVELPALPAARHSAYVKVRDRASYAFALVSLAAIIDIDRHGMIKEIRLALGGVAHKPWRASAAEAQLWGCKASLENFAAAAETELAPAVALRDNGFKIEVARRLIVRTLQSLTLEERP